MRKFTRVCVLSLRNNGALLLDVLWHLNRRVATATHPTPVSLLLALMQACVCLVCARKGGWRLNRVAIDTHRTPVSLLLTPQAGVSAVRGRQSYRTAHPSLVRVRGVEAQVRLWVGVGVDLAHTHSTHSKRHNLSHHRHPLCSHTHTHTHTRTHTHKLTHTSSLSHTQAHTRTHTHKLTHAHTHAGLRTLSTPTAPSSSGWRRQGTTTTCSHEPRPSRHPSIRGQQGRGGSGCGTSRPQGLCREKGGFM